MFGMFAIYSEEKILLILRDRKVDPERNGLWIATTRVHLQSLQKDLPSLCPVSSLKKDSFESGWQMLPADSSDFEPMVIKVCEMILKRDPRIGKTSGISRKIK